MKFSCLGDLVPRIKIDIGAAINHYKFYWSCQYIFQSFGHTDHPCIFKYVILKLKIKCVYILHF